MTILEASHRSLKADLDVDHPTIWRFISTLREVQRKRDADYERCIAGHSPEKKRSKYERADKRIKTIVEGFNVETVIDFLRGVAHNFLME